MKIARHAEILKIIRENNIETQTELVEKLNEAGYTATQATVSRDIRALGLTKAPLKNGKVHYVAPKQELQPQKYRRVLQETVVSVSEAKSMIVLKTIPGMAMAAAASIDEWNHPQIPGCIAGDDTVFCALTPDADGKKVLEELSKLLV